ncbi:septin like spn2 [Puccinia sorghi]|uniref:Septin like spn2 n=1 Tax=Puccinia sorghi TaxID=27349 RepID=A0A0L6V7L9_9BASI|nr:septin like spn2 [Puccinia sorghi]
MDKKVDDRLMRIYSQVQNLTIEQGEAFKLRVGDICLLHLKIQDELHYHNIWLYPFDNEDLDSEEMQFKEAIGSSFTDSIVGSEQNIIVDGKPVWGGNNRWINDPC